MARSLATAQQSAPVVVVSGARQTGKSTLVRGLEDEGRAYLTLDDLDVLAQAQFAPDDLVGRADRLTLDEVQRAPELLLAVKRAVDEQRTPGRFLLTGSANLLLSRTVADSLAGRAVYLTLWPLTRREQLGRGTCGIWPALFATPAAGWPELVQAQDAPREDWRELARQGGYPTPAVQLATAEERSLWFAGYTRTYLERDLQELANIASIVDFRRLMRAACLRLGQLVNQSELGRDVGLPQPTVHRYLNLLEMSYQLVRVPPYSVNRTKRLMKTPRLYWADTGLALHLAGAPEPDGPHLENLVLGDLLAWRDSEFTSPEVLYWRTTTGDEVDFVIEWQGRLLPIEVKATGRPRVADTRGLATFLGEYPDLAPAGLLLHDGDRVEWLAPGILAVPWWRVM